MGAARDLSDGAWSAKERWLVGRQPQFRIGVTFTWNSTTVVLMRRWVHAGYSKPWQMVDSRRYASPYGGSEEALLSAAIGALEARLEEVRAG